jgi:hypothetical protein
MANTMVSFLDLNSRGKVMNEGGLKLVQMRI